MRSDICILLSSIIGRGGACVPQRVPESQYTWMGLYWNQCIYEFKFQDIKMASILHPGLRYSRLDYPALSGPFSLFLRVCHCFGWRRKQRCQNYVRQLRSMSVPGPAQPVFIENRDIEGSASSSLEVQDSERAGGRGNEKERKSYPFSCRSPSNRSAARKCTVMPSGIPME